MAADFEAACTDMAMVRERVELVVAPDLSNDAVVDLYSKWARHYDQDLSLQGKYTPPHIGADEVAELLGNAKDAAILDAATGTGLVGLHLYEMGYRNLHGLDPSSGMLKEAKKKNVFTKLICDYMGPNKLDIDNDHYDAVVSVSGFASESHAKHDCFPEMIRILKPGGVFVLVINAYWLKVSKVYVGILEPAMENLEEQGKWRRIKRREIPHTFQDNSAVLIVYQKL